MHQVRAHLAHCGSPIVGDTLYVADTENHLLRRVDLTKRQVHTIAGTGEQARPEQNSRRSGAVEEEAARHERDKEGLLKARAEAEANLHRVEASQPEERRELNEVKRKTQDLLGKKNALQKDLGRLLASELQAIGLTDAHLDEHGYVYATIPANTDKKVPVICFCSHMDTSPAVSGASRHLRARHARRRPPPTVGRVYHCDACSSEERGSTEVTW